MKHLRPILVALVILFLVVTKNYTLIRVRTQETYTYLLIPILKNYKSPNPKKGLALSYTNANDATSVNATWCYNWGYEGDCGVEFYAMFWGTNYQPVSAHTVLGWNEPDRPDQANLTPLFAATEWVKVEQVYKDKILLSPGISHLGYDWIVEFYNDFVEMNGRPPRMDSLAFHCYQQVDYCVGFTEKMIGQAKAWGIPSVMVTEFAVLPCFSKTWIEDNGKLIDYFDSNPYVSKYAYYTNKLTGKEWFTLDNPECWTGYTNVFETGELTQMGEVYKNK